MSSTPTAQPACWPLPQVLESLARLDLKDADGTDLQHLANAGAILLRDSCDLLDVMGWRLQA